MPLSPLALAEDVTAIAKRLEAAEKDASLARKQAAAAEKQASSTSNTMNTLLNRTHMGASGQVTDAVSVNGEVVVRVVADDGGRGEQVAGAVMEVQEDVTELRTLLENQHARLERLEKKNSSSRK